MQVVGGWWEWPKGLEVSVSYSTEFNFMLLLLLMVGDNIAHQGVD